MKVSKKSWHYRLLRLYGWNIPNYLCPYFWRTVWCILVLPITLILFIPCMLYFTLTEGWDDWNGFTDEYPFALMVDVLILLTLSMGAMWFINPKTKDELHQVILILGWVGWSVLGMLTILGIIGFIKDNLPKSKHKKPSMVAEFIKAKKSKLCPKIEWEDDEEA